jgi:hypothetical protein
MVKRASGQDVKAGVVRTKCTYGDGGAWREQSGWMSRHGDGGGDGGPAAGAD